MSPESARPSLQAARATPVEESVRSSRDFEERIDDTAKGAQINVPLPPSTFAPVIVSWPKLASDDQTTTGSPLLRTLVTLRTASEVMGWIIAPLAPHCATPEELNFCPEIPSFVRGPGIWSSQKR